MKLNDTKISREVEEKYLIHDNSFDLDVVKNSELDKKGEVKDNVQAIIGDDKQPDTFIPQLKLCRWANETNFSIRLKDTEKGTETVDYNKDRINWHKGNIDIEFYDFEDGYKLVWWLKEKPKTNKVEFTIQSKGLKFYYQPELTQKEKDEGAERPENVVGSYAVYHDTKGGLNDSGGKEYKVGKAFHIYRPHIIDAEGNETWGILKIENGIYSVEIPQDFLDAAVYPIKSNDTFGYTTEGETKDSPSGNYVNATLASPDNNGSVDSVTAYVGWGVYPSDDKIKGGIWKESDDSLLGNPGAETTVTSSFGWRTSAIASNNPEIKSTDDYLIGVVWWNWYGNIACDSGSSGDGIRDINNDYDSPKDLQSRSEVSYKYSIYATYEAEPPRRRIRLRGGVRLLGNIRLR